MKPSKFYLYEQSVQSPEWKVNYLPQFHRQLHKKLPHSFREDFCGSGKIAASWVELNAKNTALGLDLDTEALKYAVEENRASLNPSQQSRLKFKKQNVLQKTSEKFDMIGAYNFSCFEFHDRKTLLKYAKSAFQSLSKKGTFFLEIAGGKDFLSQDFTTRTLRTSKMGKVNYTW